MNKYTESQIERAKKAYNQFLQYRSVSYYMELTDDRNEAVRRSDLHNSEVQAILNGDKELEKSWKMHFCNEEFKKDAKAAESAAKLAANKSASADILAPVKAAKKIVAFGQWLNTKGNPFRTQHFNKKYTVEAVDAFMATI